MIEDKELKCVFQDGSEALYEYSPTLFKLHYTFLGPYFTGRKIRYVYEFLHSGHYLDYYYAINDKIVGQCVVIPGGRRIEGTTEKDICIGGPYYILSEYRGRGLSIRMLDLVLNHCGYEYEYVYDYILKGNSPSINASRKLGMEQIGEGDIVGPFHMFRRLPNNGGGKFNLYRMRHK